MFACITKISKPATPNFYLKKIKNMQLIDLSQQNESNKHHSNNAYNNNLFLYTQNIQRDER